MDITYQYTKKREDFGRQPMFSEQGPEICDSVACDTNEHRNYILRNPVHQPTQNTRPFSTQRINTLRADYTTTGTNHAEGGWPRDINVLDPEATQRYRRKVEKEDGYIHCVQSNAPGVEHYVMQNNAINMYGIYYGEIPQVPTPTKMSCRTLNVYRDPSSISRPISSICWEPGGGSRFAVTYNDVTFTRTPRAPLYCYIWNAEDPMTPEMTVTTSCALLDLQFNSRDLNMLAGGLMNGQVGVWDRRAGGAVAATCAPHVAHRDLVRNVKFVAAKSGHEFFSSGPDGMCKWWDMRNLSDIIEEIVLDQVKSSFEVPDVARACGASVLEFEPTVPTRFMVGTENGLVLVGNRKGKTAIEKIPIKFEAHVGPVWSLERNPGFLKNFLTVGDWTVRVWSEECHESAVLWSPPLRHKVTAGAWSPTRFSLMVLTQWDGTLAVWDLLRRQHEPVFSMQVCSEPLLCLHIHERGQLLACGSRNGNVYMAELLEGLAQNDKNDKSQLTLMLDRESKRERILEARMREIRLKVRQGEGGGLGGGGGASTLGLVASASALELDADRDLDAAAVDYLQQVKKELLTMV